MNTDFLKIAERVKSGDRTVAAELLAIANPDNQWLELMGLSSITHNPHDRSDEKTVIDGVKIPEKSDIANGSYANTGYQTPLDTLTALSRDLIEAQAVVDDAELSAVIPMQTSFQPYMEKVKYQLMGVTADSIYGYEISSNHQGAIKAISTEGKSFETERRLYAFSISSSIIADRQQSAAGLLTTDYGSKLKGIVRNSITFTQEHRAFGIQKAPGFWSGGLLTPNPVYDRPVDHTLLIKPIQDMTPAELQTFLKDAITEYSLTTFGRAADTIILPNTAIPALAVLYQTITGMPMTNRGVIELVLTSANNNKPVKIIGSPYFAAENNGKKYNINNGKGEDFVVLLNSAEAEIFFDEPVPMQLISTVTAGISTTSILLMQLGETVMRRPEFVSVHSYLRP